MQTLDWLLVFALNGSVILYALWMGRGIQTSSEWFLAGRSLPWWLVGLSLYATVVDSTDIVSDSGAAYRLGLRFLVVNCLGVIGGWVLLSQFLLPTMYRARMVTNAEYLEDRFGVTARVISVVVQVLYRTTVMGMISTTNYLLLTIVCGWTREFSWGVVLAIATVATIYTMVGGLKSVAITDGLQSIVMFVASLVVFGLVWTHVGGWQGLQDRLATQGSELPAQLLHVGNDDVVVISTADMEPGQRQRELLLGGEYNQPSEQIIRRTPAWLVSCSLILAGVAYAIVNHTQTMRLLGARSILASQQAVLLAGTLLIAVTILHLMVGVMGRAIHFDITRLPVDAPLQKIDAVYPVLVRDLVPVGLKGLVVAGILAAVFSTYDSIGSTLSALITQDVYGRLIAPGRDDAHYLAVGRWLTPVTIFGSFAYVPALLHRGMVFFYLDVVGAFVLPLLAVYLMGRFTPAHRAAGTMGLLVGASYGVVSFLAPGMAQRDGIVLLPTALLNPHAHGPMTFLVTVCAMIATSQILGWQTPDQRRAASGEHPPSTVLGSIALLAIAGLLCFVLFW